jgi:hypothetical protein
VVGANQLADLQRARDVGAECPVRVRRCVEGGRPDGYAPPGRLQLVYDLQEAIREARVHDDQGMDVGRDGRVVEEDGVDGRSTAILVGPGLEDIIYSMALLERGIMAPWVTLIMHGGADDPLQPATM